MKTLTSHPKPRAKFAPKSRSMFKITAAEGGWPSRAALSVASSRVAVRQLRAMFPDPTPILVTQAECEDNRRVAVATASNPAEGSAPRRRTGKEAAGRWARKGRDGGHEQSNIANDWPKPAEREATSVAGTSGY